MTEREKIVEVMARGIEDAFWADLSSDAIAESALTALEASCMAVVPVELPDDAARVASRGAARAMPSDMQTHWRLSLSALAASPTPSMTENADE